MWKSKYEVKNGNELVPTASHEFFDLQVKTTDEIKNGLFALEFIPEGSVIIQDGGLLITCPDDIPPEKRGYGIVINEGVYLIPRDYDHLDKCCFLNHSCNSNVARIGYNTYIAKKHIQSGEELTIDYAGLTATMEDWTLECKCGAIDCRKVITSSDWKDPIISTLLWKEWPPFIQRKLIASGKFKAS